jgi:C-terminal processing protease CtpA/Prc
MNTMRDIRSRLSILIVGTLLTAPLAAQQQGTLLRGMRFSDSTRTESLQQLETQIDSLSRELALLRDRADDAKTDAEKRDLQNGIMRTTARRSMLRSRLATLQRTNQNDDVLRQRVVEEEMARARLLATKTGQTMFIVPSRLPQAPGYIGVTYSGDMQYRGEGSELVVEHRDWPVIVSVEPRSPAARAGLSSGDTVISYNGYVLRNNKVSLSKLLKPGDTLTVKIRRDQSVRDVPVIVGRRPGATGLGSGGTWVAIGPEDVWTATTTPRAVTSGRARVSGTAPTPAPSSGPRTTVSGALATTPMPPVGFAFTTSNAVAGADLQRIKGDLAEVFGVERGVLVLDVQKSSIADRAGLRGGDVVLEAGGEKVYTPLDIRRAMEKSRGDGRLELRIIRKKKQQTISLQWD